MNKTVNNWASVNNLNYFLIKYRVKSYVVKI